MEAYFKENPPACQLDARDAVELIHSIVRLELALQQNLDASVCAGLRERLELEKRALTDYFLVSDVRKGVYVRGDHDH